MFHTTLAISALLSITTYAQTSTLCDPLNSTCPPDSALGTTYDETFTAQTVELNPNLWNVTAGSDLIHFTNNGAELAISQSGQSVTAQSTFYIFWGQVEIIMQAASGTGIISTFDLLSDDLDEIDMEIMGGNTSWVESNWYGWGDQTQYNSEYLECDGPQQKMHNYTIVWSQEQIQWIVDGNVSRIVPYAAPHQYPQTPSILKFGIWAGGDATEPEGTIQWAGGKTDWSKGPFTMTVQSIKITDGSTNTSSYAYGDRSGSYNSIQAVAGESTAYKILNKQSTLQSVLQIWKGLSEGAKIGIVCGVSGFFACVIVACTVCCIIQRKKGRAEKAIADKEWDAHTNELMEYRVRMAKGEFAVAHLTHGEKS
ncbi:glycoside hydrolase family 16 protein [Baudoinia panamericana UAMH 10762]|uniref:chitinase n=1 Tax=Baudoinia panamericana (strain UAMH 10762) TaxID=717646 RepID=M2LZ63_BAUPA|nr:glycoside hydrolase family 16 protein [Baudoinia panamericana UAMH 10762]EMC99972.1 glycoside hydrolase family 16 protein [Baudoinia panamericana UAMH 10762]